MTLKIRYLLVHAAVIALVCYGSRPVGAASHPEERISKPACPALPPASSSGFEAKLDIFIFNSCYRVAGWRHDATIHTSDGVHPFVKIWYSPEIWTWMTINQRKGAPPDGQCW